MKRSKKGCGVTAYLEAKGLLENSSKEIIDKAKEEYWRRYRYEWLKRKRQSKSFTIYLNELEFGQISTNAKKHKRSNTRFIKEAALAYVRQKFLVPDSLAINEMKGLLTQIHVLFKSLATDKRIGYREVEKQLQMIMTLEMLLINQLTNPTKLTNDC